MNDETAQKIFGILAKMQEENSRRFDEIDQKFDTFRKEIDLRFEGIDKRLDAVDKRLDEMDVRLDKMDARLDRMDARLDKMDIRLDGMGIQVKKAHERLDEMNKKFSRKFDGVYNLLDRQTDMLDTDEVERLSLTKQVDRHDDWIERAAPKVGVKYAAKG